MAGVARRLRLRLFLEGVEVPVIAATVQCAPNGPSVCSIQIPPLAEGTRLFPRTLVHLFFLDSYEVASPITPVKGAGKSKADITIQNGLGVVQGGSGPNSEGSHANTPALPSAQSDDFRSDHSGTNKQYKLLFGGEVVGFQWTKNESSRSIVLQCLDWSNYWDYAYQWNNTDIFGPGLKAQFSGGATNLFTDFLEGEGLAIIKLLQTPSANYPKLKGLLGGIVHVLEAIGGSYFQKNKFGGQNIFFTVAELRLRLTQMITAFEDDPTSARLLNADSFGSLFGRTLGGLGAQVSFRQAINALQALIFHETYAIPTPMFVPGDVIGRSATKTTLNKDRVYGFLGGIALGAVQSINSIQKDIEGQTGSADNTTFRVGLPEQLTRLIKVCTDAANRASDVVVKAVKGMFTAASKILFQAKTQSKKLKSEFSAPSGKQTKESPTLKRISVLLAKAVEVLAKINDYQISRTAEQVQVARLNAQIFRPDVWFSAPPRCNVIFPEGYGSLSYARSFLQEPTRLLLKTNDEYVGEDELFDAFYYAPTAALLKPKKEGQTDLQAVLGRNLFDHELMTGILPVFEKMGELNIFGARSGAKNGKKTKIGMAQRTTNFLYFKYRFAARQMQFSGKFNPYIVPGFPGLVIDKYVDKDVLEKRQAIIDGKEPRAVAGEGQSTGSATLPSEDRFLGTHFLANFTEVSHSVSQERGETSVNCGYARQPEESVEFLGAISASQTVRKRADVDAKRVTVVASLNAPKVNAQGPGLGVITGVENVTDAHRAQNLATGAKFPLFNAPKKHGVSKNIRVPVGITLIGSVYGKDVGALFGADVPIRFGAYRVTESVPKFRQEIVDLPAEEYIRPGWYGDCWHPALIGKVYSQFFGTGSITDQQQVTTGGGASVGIEHEKAEKALAEASVFLQKEDYLSAGATLLALDKDSSVQAAVSFIVATYSAVRQGGFDVEEFIRAFTWRPIASMEDILGSVSLEFSADGSKVTNGNEGLHSKAFGPYNDLFGLVTDDIVDIAGLHKGTWPAQHADTRKRKQDAVKAYVSALSSRAIVG